jgi:hypothetical protein
MEAHNGTAALIQHVNLARQAPWCTPVVIIPMANYFAESLPAAEVALLSDVALLG